MVADGDERAFERIYERYGPEVFRYCAALVRHRQDAEEAFQHTMLAAYKAMASGRRRPPESLRPWLFRIAHNECVDLVRARPFSERLVEHDDPAAGAVHERVEAREELRQLRIDLAALPLRQRSALLLRELSGLSHDAVGTALGTTAADARHLVHEARMSLAEFSAGRDLGCDQVCRTITEGDRRSLRARRVKAHLRGCEDCRAFAETQDERRRRLGVFFPFLAPALAAEILRTVLGSGGAAGGAAAITAGTQAITGAGGGGGSAGGGGAAAGGAAGTGTVAAGLGAAAIGGFAAAGAVAVGVAATVAVTVAGVGPLASGDGARPSTPAAAVAPSSSGGITTPAGTATGSQPGVGAQPSPISNSTGGGAATPTLIPAVTSPLLKTPAIRLPKLPLISLPKLPGITLPQLLPALPVTLPSLPPVELPTVTLPALPEIPPVEVPVTVPELPPVQLPQVELPPVEVPAVELPDPVISPVRLPADPDPPPAQPPAEASAAPVLPPADPPPGTELPTLPEIVGQVIGRLLP